MHRSAAHLPVPHKGLHSPLKLRKLRRGEVDVNKITHFIQKKMKLSEPTQKKLTLIGVSLALLVFILLRGALAHGGAELFDRMIGGVLHMADSR